MPSADCYPEGGSSFWATLHLLIKSNPEGDLIKIMLETPTNDHTVRVKLGHFTDEGYHYDAATRDVKTDDLPEWMRTSDQAM